MNALIPPSLTFRRERESTWRELEALVFKIERGSLKRLDARELGRLPLLYRSTVSSLAVARSMCLSRELLDYLESLTARATICMTTPRPDFRGALRAFFGERFPRLVRRLGWHVGVSAMLLWLGVAAGFVLTVQDTERFYNFVPEAYAQGRDPAASTDDLRAVLYDEAVESDELSAFASFLLSNNAKVGMLCFALGFAFGVPVIYLLFTNGLILGAFAGLYHTRGLSWEFWAWVMPHGVTELFAVILCGAAGLAMAQAIVFPGRASRLRNLADVGRSAGVVVLGAVFLFLVAAVIEGFFRQLVHDVTLRTVVVASSASLWAAYFLLVGRGDTPHRTLPKEVAP